MAVIDRYRKILTTFEVFDVPKENAAEFIEEFSLFIDKVSKGRCGFISSNLHYSEEEGEVLSYSQWKSLKDYDDFIHDDEIRERRDLFYSKLVKTTQSSVVYTS